VKPQKIEFTVNNKVIQVEPFHQDWTLLRYLREVLRLTGARQSCDNEGACGSCTVIIDGQPRRACRERVENLRWKNIQTIESLAIQPGEFPHPLLQTVIQDGIFQCGYCAPGAIMVAKALLDYQPNPSPQEVQDALTPVVCRCSSLYRIDRSVLRAAAILRGDEPSTWSEEDTQNEYMALDKLTGKLHFTDDLSFPGMLYGQALRSPIPHARVTFLDPRQAESMPGVVKILTAKDVPGQNRYGLLIRDQPIFCDEIVRYVGDCLALVIAETQDQACAALGEIKVQLEPLPVINNPQDSLESDAPILHEYLREKTPATPNLLCHHSIRKGDVEKGFAQADLIIEENYTTPFVDHAYMELECSIGVPEKNGEITLYCGSQGPTFDRDQIAEALGIDPLKVRIAHRYVGGAFGGKEDVAGQVLASLGAYMTGHPVKVLFSRAESLRVHHKRHAESMHYKVGTTKDGQIVAAEVTIYGDTGAYASTGEAVLFRSATFACGPYVVPNVKVDTYAVHTNNPTCGAFRGFGGTQVAFSSEVHLQKIIDALGMDPFEFRLENAIDIGRATITGHVLTPEVGAGYKACLNAVRETLQNVPRPALKPAEKLGIGVAGAYKNVGLGSGIPDGAGARLTLQRDGSFLLRHGAADIGQGVNEAMAMIVSRALGVPIRMIQLHTGDTKYDPLGGMTTASRATFVTGNATLLASQKLRQQLWQAVASEFNLQPGQIELHQDVFVEKVSGRKLVSLKALAAASDPFEAEANFDAPETNRVPFHSDCWPTTDSSQHRLHFAYCYGVQAAMVAVNELTGEIRVLKIIAAHDVGQAISRRNCIGQIEGAVVQGLGYALTEQFPMLNGYPQVDQFRKLGLLHLKDLPDITAILVEEPHPRGPFGAKGMGELAISPTAPAVVNAIHDAIGVWVNELPVTPEKVISALKKKEGRLL
jgi:aldehyde oxidoreductase